MIHGYHIHKTDAFVRLNYISMVKNDFKENFKNVCLKINSFYHLLIHLTLQISFIIFNKGYIQFEKIF